MKVTNLSGVFVEEIESRKINDELVYGFQLLFGFKSTKFYTNSEEQCDLWLKTIRKVTGFVNIKDIYEILVKIII